MSELFENKTSEPSELKPETPTPLELNRDYGVSSGDNYFYNEYIREQKNVRFEESSGSGDSSSADVVISDFELEPFRLEPDLDMDMNSVFSESGSSSGSGSGSGSRDSGIDRFSGWPNSRPKGVWVHYNENVDRPIKRAMLSLNKMVIMIGFFGILAYYTIQNYSPEIFDFDFGSNSNSKLKFQMD